MLKNDCAKDLYIFPANEKDIPFIKSSYDENIDALHGEKRSIKKWRELLCEGQSIYYIVANDKSLAWFRVDFDGDILWLGLIVVAKQYQMQGVGKFILSQAETLAKENDMTKIGVHTTEDNVIAKRLYEKSGFEITEFGDCLTADGTEMQGYTFIKCLDKN